MGNCCLGVGSRRGEQLEFFATDGSIVTVVGSEQYRWAADLYSKGEYSTVVLKDLRIQQKICFYRYDVCSP